MMQLVNAKEGFKMRLRLAIAAWPVWVLLAATSASATIAGHVAQLRRTECSILRRMGEVRDAGLFKAEVPAYVEQYLQAHSSIELSVVERAADVAYAHPDRSPAELEHECTAGRGLFSLK
jgi:hypothetical protein